MQNLRQLYVFPWCTLEKKYFHSVCFLAVSCDVDFVVTFRMVFSYFLFANDRYESKRGALHTSHAGTMNASRLEPVFSNYLYLYTNAWLPSRLHVSVHLYLRAVDNRCYLVVRHTSGIRQTAGHKFVRYFARSILVPVFADVPFFLLTFFYQLRFKFGGILLLALFDPWMPCKTPTRP